MQVFKFGGASIRHAAGVKQVTSIIKGHQKEKILVVVSAMGKTTNALERVVENFRQEKDFKSELDGIRKYHGDIMHELFHETNDVWKKVAASFDHITRQLKPGIAHDQLYDQVVSMGEVISSIIISEYVLTQDLDAEWLDARKYIKTDTTFREGKIDWDQTESNILNLKSVVNSTTLITQGFIGSCDGLTVTLGREGSDYTAAIFASCLGASSVTIWKDVPGVMNADPKRLPDAVVFEELPFREAAEMTYYGASVIHPKTIKPLANKNIPLLVKNLTTPPSRER
ncbi:MAG: aspartate kinase [Bacteroidota bacterium]